MRIAYADPPYLGQAQKHYSHDPLCAEVDHDELFSRLREYDGWALSLSSPSLGTILRLPNCPAAVRVGVWVKPFASFKPGVNPAYAWEPVLFHPARSGERDKPTVRDWVSANITLERGLSGAKPAGFCYWLFALLGAEQGDDFADLYPGTGGVTRAWRHWAEGETEVKGLPMFQNSTVEL